MAAAIATSSFGQAGRLRAGPSAIANVASATRRIHGCAAAKPWSWYQPATARPAANADQAANFAELVRLR